MSNLRKQLETAKREYRQARYPGDLVADVLPPVRHTARWMWNLGAVAAAAAMIVFAVRLRPTDSTSTQPPLAIEVPAQPAVVQEQLTEVSLSDLPAISVPAGPSNLDMRGTDEMNMAPAAPDFSFSVPTFSLLEDQQSTQSSSTQETIL